MASVVQFTVDDSSPTVSYFPFGDTLSSPNLLAGWNPHWTSPGFSGPTIGSIGSGNSLHITSHDGASMQIVWKGTGIKLFGNATRSSYDITLDGKVAASTSADPSNNVLVALDNLPDTNHTLSLTMQTNATDSLLTFDKATISAPLLPSNVSSSNFTERVLNDTVVSFRGQWSFTNDPNASHKSTTAGDSAALQFTGACFLLRGTTSPDAGRYSVTLDNVTTSFSGESSFTETDSLLFFASGLDAETVHNLEIVNTDGASLVLPLGGATVFALAQSTSTPSSSPTSVGVTAVSHGGLSGGTIAALILAGVLIFLLILSAVLYFMLYRPYRRRKRMLRRQPKDDPDHDAVSVMVVDVARETLSKKMGFYDDVPVAGPSRDRTSKRSGFTRWKEEVEGGLGSLGRGALGIAFRHSDSTGRRDASGASSHDYDIEIATLSYKSTSSSDRYETGEGNGKGKARESSRWPRRRQKSTSPRFRVGFPIEPRSRSASRSNGASGGPSVISSLSYLSSPSLRPTTVPSAPLSPSSRRPSPSPNTHSRVGSSGALLVHSDEPPPSEPDGGYNPSSLPPLGPLPPLPVPTQPPEPARQDDRGSVREYDADDGRSILGDGSARIALRSLSPRTSEAEDRKARKKRRAKQKRTESSPLSNPIDTDDTDGSPGGDGDTPPSEIPPTSLFLRSTSPFHVDFDESDPRAARLSGQSRVRFEGDLPGTDNDSAQASTGKGGKRSKASTVPFRLTPQSDHLRDTSFLDFASSSSGSNAYSTSSRSIGSQAQAGHSRWSTGGSSSMMASIIPPPQPKSRWSTTTAPSSDINHDDPSASSSDSNFPFPVSLPPSPHHPDGTFIPQQSSFGVNLELPTQSSTLSSLNSHPSDLISEHPSSPTDSVPMSVSDIHFRHSGTDEQNGSRRQSSSGLPTHPPLPPAPIQTEESYIVQRVVGMYAPSPNIPATMLTSPTPTAATFITNPDTPSPGSSGRGL